MQPDDIDNARLKPALRHRTRLTPKRTPRTVEARTIETAAIAHTLRNGIRRVVIDPTA